MSEVGQRPLALESTVALLPLPRLRSAPPCFINPWSAWLGAWLSPFVP